MNKLVKILLVILAALLLAAGGFWSGTRFARTQTANNPVLSSASNTPSDSASVKNNNNPGFNREGNFRNSGSNNGFGNRSENVGPNLDRFGYNKNFSQGMMADGMQGGQMMSNRLFPSYRGVSVRNTLMVVIMMLFGSFFTLGIATLLVLGIIILFRLVRKPAVNPVINTAVCSKCGRAIQADWKHCPHCGEMLA